MTKTEFLKELEIRLSTLPKDEAYERIGFYREMIDDMIEEGTSESDAVAKIGTPDDVASQIISEMPLTKIVMRKIKPKRKLSALEVILLVLGSPVWLSVFVVVAAVTVSLYAVLWAIIAVFWSVFAAFAAGTLCGLAALVLFVVKGYILTGAFMLFGGFVCAGLSVFVFIGCLQITKKTALLSAKAMLGIKKMILRGKNR